MLYERTALSKKTDKLIKQELAALREEDRLTPDLVFRDPYILDFLGLTTHTAKRTWKKPFSASWKGFSWNWERTSPF